MLSDVVSKNSVVNQQSNPDDFGGISWNPRLPRKLSDSAISKVACLNSILDRPRASDKKDELRWCDGSDDFRVKVCYTKILKLQLRFFSYGVLNLDWDRIWNKRAPSKNSFFCWVLERDRVLRHRETKVRGISLATRCILCCEAAEGSSLLFSGCSVSQVIWAYFLSTGRYHKIAAVEGFSGDVKEGSLICSVLAHAIVCESNSRIFDGNAQTVEKLIQTYKKSGV